MSCGNAGKPKRLAGGCGAQCNGRTAKPAGESLRMTQARAKAKGGLRAVCEWSKGGGCKSLKNEGGRRLPFTAGLA
ncbi:MAG: hypothetical protein CMP48_14935 [Rickettsiales bacterium]|nr:hypothetical protein [Rickettsiales bacterium]